jgi:hypothetical protein
MKTDMAQELPTLDAREALAQHAREAAAAITDRGAIVVRNAFSPSVIAALLKAVTRHAEVIIEHAERGEPTHFPEHYRWVQRALACDLGALDPSTGPEGSDDFNNTTLHAAVLSPFVQAILRMLIGDDAGYGVIRTRVVLPRAAGNGFLPLHKESTAVPWPGLVVVWTPLTPPDIVTNQDAPGIQFRDQTGDIFCPLLRAGDLAIFNGEIEHGSHIPTTATHWRVGCDIRLFPWTEANPIPPETIALGYGPRRLRWRTR